MTCEPSTAPVAELEQASNCACALFGAEFGRMMETSRDRIRPVLFLTLRLHGAIEVFCVGGGDGELRDR